MPLYARQCACLRPIDRPGACHIALSGTHSLLPLTQRYLGSLKAARSAARAACSCAARPARYRRSAAVSGSALSMRSWGSLISSATKPSAAISGAAAAPEPPLPCEQPAGAAPPCGEPLLALPAPSSGPVGRSSPNAASTACSAARKAAGCSSPAGSADAAASAAAACRHGRQNELQ